MKRHGIYYCDRCESAADRRDLIVTADGWERLCEFCYEAHTREEEDGAQVEDERGALFSWGSSVFVGHDTGRDWNGFAVPEFDYAETVAILHTLREYGTVVNVSVSGSIVSYVDVDRNETVEVAPNRNGRYVFDGFSWDGVEFTHVNTLELLNERITFNLNDNQTDSHGFVESFRDELLDLWRACFGFDTVTPFRALQDYVDNH